MKIIGVRFKPVGRIFYFDATGFDIDDDTTVIAESQRGLELGTVVQSMVAQDLSKFTAPLKKIARIATDKDFDKDNHNKILEKQALTECSAKIKTHKLDMKLIAAEYTLDRSKLLFYFTAEGRVDFRDLVRDLAFLFKTRIELRQIGVRDKSKMVGGLGICGRTLCCATHLADFEPVSINMAKDQNLSLNPVKISGSCGRLMCCLKYEQDVYEELGATLPPPEALVQTPDGNGIVLETQTLKGMCRVKLKDKDGYHIYKAEDLKVLRVFKNNKKDRYDHELSKIARD